MADFELPILRSDRRLCKICGELSEELICEACKINIRGEVPIVDTSKDSGEAGDTSPSLH